MSQLEEFAKDYQKIDEIPFDFSRRRLSVILKIENRIQMITKGAVEEILSICSNIEQDGITCKIDNEQKQKIKKMTKELNEQGLRVVAVCSKNIENVKESYNQKDEEKMTLMRFCRFFRPAKRKC